MLVVIASLGLYYDFDSFRSSSFHADRDSLVSALQHARIQAMSNVCLGGSACTDGRSHGVRIRPADHPTSYVIFQSGDGNSNYLNRDDDFDSIFEINPTTKNGVNMQPDEIDEVLFEQLSGDVTVDGVITLTDDAGHTSIITISSEGQISWTN